MDVIIPVELYFCPIHADPLVSVWFPAAPDEKHLSFYDFMMIVLAHLLLMTQNTVYMYILVPFTVGTIY